MRLYFLLAILGLAIVEAFLLPRTIKDFRIMRNTRHEARSEEGQPAAIGPFAGYDADGRPLTLVHDDTRWIVPMMIHSSQLPADLDYLARLRKALPKNTVVLVGICDNNHCGKQLQEPGLPILTYGSYAALVQIARYDDRNQVLLLNQFWGVREPLKRAESPEEMAKEIQQVIAP